MIYLRFLGALSINTPSTIPQDINICPKILQEDNSQPPMPRQSQKWLGSFIYSIYRPNNSPYHSTPMPWFPTNPFNHPPQGAYRQQHSQILLGNITLEWIKINQTQLGYIPKKSPRPFINSLFPPMLINRQIFPVQ